MNADIAQIFLALWLYLFVDTYLGATAIEAIELGVVGCLVWTLERSQLVDDRHKDYRVDENGGVSALTSALGIKDKGYFDRSTRFDTNWCLDYRVCCFFERARKING